MTLCVSWHPWLIEELEQFRLFCGVENLDKIIEMQTKGEAQNPHPEFVDAKLTHVGSLCVDYCHSHRGHCLVLQQPAVSKAIKPDCQMVAIDYELMVAVWPALINIRYW